MSDTTPIPPASERERFEADARPYGFDLTRDENTTGEPWCDYKDHDTGHRWGGWLAALEPHKLPVGAALSHPSTPQGWKLVPVEPVLVMLQAGRDLDLEAPGNGWLTNLPHYELRDIWQAMLNAAPPPPEQGGKG